MCSDSSLIGILSIIKRIMLLIQITVPIFLIVYASIQFISLTKNPDQKEGTKKIINKFIAAVIVFFIPLTVNIVMNIIGENTNFSSCWNEANDNINSKTNYHSIYDEDKRKSITHDSSKYEVGERSNISFNLDHALQVGDYVHANENASLQWNGQNLGPIGGSVGAYTEAVNILNETDYRIYEVYNVAMSYYPEAATHTNKDIYQMSEVNHHYNLKVSNIDRNVSAIKQTLLEGKLVQAITDTNLFRNSKNELVNWSGRHWGLIFYYDGTYFHMKNAGTIRQKDAIYTETQLQEWLASTNFKARPIVYERK